MQNNVRQQQYRKVAYFGTPLFFFLGFVSGFNLDYAFVNHDLAYLMNSSPVVYLDRLDLALKWGLILSVAYVVAIYVWLSCIRNFRPGEEYGTADWGNVTELNLKYAGSDPAYAKHFTEHFSLSYDNEAVERNTNALIVASSGGGKTFKYAVPNILAASSAKKCSFVDIDPKGEHLSKTGNRMRRMGYRISVLNLIDFSQSDCYNPFRYIRKGQFQRDIENLVDTIFSASGSGDSKENAFWNNSAKALFKALMFYVYLECPTESQNFGAVMELKRKACCVTGSAMSPNAPTEADPVFDELARRDPSHLALRYWHEYATGSANVKKDVASTLNSCLSNFNNDELIKLTRFDDLDLDTLGNGEPRIIYVVVSETDTSLNFIVSIFYSQLFNTLFRTADEVYHGFLPSHVELLMDEFANIKLPEDFEKKLAVFRSRNISASIILQDLSQLKALYKDVSDSLINNCDTLLCLGVNGKDTPQYISELMGAYTIATRSSSEGGHGGGGFTVSQTGRDLLKGNEIRLLGTDQALVLLRGEQPMRDTKIHILKQPKWRQFITYSAYDKKTGEKYINLREKHFVAFDMANSVSLDDVRIQPQERCYYFVTYDEARQIAPKKQAGN